MRRVLVCGDRAWTDYDAILRELADLPAGTTIIHGGARGADQMAGAVAAYFGLAVEVHVAQWERYGRWAGPIRNGAMLRQGTPDSVLAFHSNLGKSKGTLDMVTRALDAGLPVKVVAK